MDITRIQRFFRTYALALKYWASGSSWDDSVYSAKMLVNGFVRTKKPSKKHELYQTILLCILAAVVLEGLIRSWR